MLYDIINIANFTIVIFLTIDQSKILVIYKILQNQRETINLTKKNYTHK